MEDTVDLASHSAQASKPPERKKKRGAVLLYEKLRDDIMWMEIEPGTVLDEVALAARYEVSRTPVREALLLLENEGFVQFLPNRSTIVAPLTMSNIPALFDTFLLLARATARAAAAGETDKEALHTAVEMFRHDLEAGSIRTAFEAQIELYRILASAAQNRFLAKYLLEAQTASVRLKQLYFFPNLDADSQAEAGRLLAGIVDAIVARDPDASDAAVVRSILFEADVVQKSLGPKFGHMMEISSVAPVKEPVT